MATVHNLEKFMALSDTGKQSQAETHTNILRTYKTAVICTKFSSDKHMCLVIQIFIDLDVKSSFRGKPVLFMELNYRIVAGPEPRIPISFHHSQLFGGGGGGDIVVPGKISDFSMVTTMAVDLQWLLTMQTWTMKVIKILACTQRVSYSECVIKGTYHCAWMSVCFETREGVADEAVINSWSFL